MARTQDLVNSITVTENISTLQRRTAYTAANLPEYIGYAPKGAATSDNSWTIFKYTYNGTGLETLKQTSYDAWDNYLTADYA